MVVESYFNKIIYLNTRTNEFFYTSDNVDNYSRAISKSTRLAGIKKAIEGVNVTYTEDNEFYLVSNDSYRKIKVVRFSGNNLFLEDGKGVVIGHFDRSFPTNIEADPDFASYKQNLDAIKSIDASIDSLRVQKQDLVKLNRNLLSKLNPVNIPNYLRKTKEK